QDLIRTTLYVISPALAAETVPSEFGLLDREAWTGQRSRLYHPGHSRLFRERSDKVKNEDD
ncbi:MAG: hypothetical protein LH702_01410, partial [Phormidesmis sp. CAN_BIN44]|nr:hypothetical protein [Phormidesmis sp. CAN_BIN44]